MIQGNKLGRLEANIANRFELQPQLINTWLEKYGKCEQSSTKVENYEHHNVMICMSPWG